ncbi:conserved Plasmodium protein, unknown function [Babesia microti strain RI]|uniref:C3H1-type domain-containing protein n=1 Tax=Babesia microti (strain RI) TaxID=1133968 RepID=A0A1N6LWC0_BABMR|nr:conserved Plasmodium protein, unknown function [Babesia microti strain RI]SIO73169.1 conserved Plasmodium protein, unknown function [Babesia microti strain RI]|eukprot:XP_021337279.1 conserved Plasmodium protein, unknown function [Babesia microti strain RI]
MQQNYNNGNETELANATYHTNVTYYRASPQYYNRNIHYVTNPSQYVQYPCYYQMPQQFNGQAIPYYNAGPPNYPQQYNNPVGNHYNNTNQQHHQYNASRHAQMVSSHNRKPTYSNRGHGYRSHDKNKYNCKTKSNNEANFDTYECQICNLYFDKKQKLEKHLKNDHIPCIHEGCNFSAPLQILEIHAFKHLKNNKGELFVDSPEEIRIWRERRRANHPSNPHKLAAQNDSEISTRCSLEDLLRSSMNAFTTNPPTMTQREQECKTSALVPLLNKIAPPPSSLYSFLEPEKADRKIQSLEAKFGGPYSYSRSLKKKFNICNMFLRKKFCKYGANCAYSHDVSAFKRWKKLQFNLQVPKRPPLLYRLLKPEILMYEEMLIRGIVYIVKSNFLQPKILPLIEELCDKNEV